MNLPESRVGRSSSAGPPIRGFSTEVAMRKAYLLLPLAMIAVAEANACVTAPAIPKDFVVVFTGTVEAMPHEKMEAANHFTAISTVYLRLTNTTEAVAPVTVAIESDAAG